MSNEEGIPENKTVVPVLQEMINDIRESTASLAQASNTYLFDEDLHITQVLALPTSPEHDVLSEEISSTDDVNNFDSICKRLSIALNSAAAPVIPESEEQHSSTTIPIEPTPVQQIDNIQSYPLPSSLQTTTLINPPKKKQHIMISYNRSCENTCRKIRNSLKELKYNVWMDLYDMHDNFIDGTEEAIRNSYIVLICINRNYGNSYWCKKEIQYIAIKKIKFIPCFMEEPFELVDWLKFLVNGNIWIDFSKDDQFDKSFNQLIGEITSVEESLAIYPRETPPTTPIINPITTITSNPTIEQSFDMVMRNFETSIEENRDNLKRFNRKQSSQLINQLIQGLQNDDTTPENRNTKEVLQPLIYSTVTLEDRNQSVLRLVNNLNISNSPLIESLLFTMALRAQRLSSEETDVQSTPVFNSDLVGISLQSSKPYIASFQQSNMDSIPIILKPISNNTSNILIACLNVSSSISLNSKYSIESFDDERICIVRLLSMNNKRVYFIVSNSVAEYIIPLIHQYRCVEQIYIYCPNEKQRSPPWIIYFPKISGCWTDYSTLLATVFDDIQSILSPSSLWSNVKLIERLHTQTLINSLEEPIVSFNMLNVEKYSDSNKQMHIVVLHCDNDTLFHANSQHFLLFEFSDVVECVQHLEGIDVKSVFFIVSGEIKSIIHNLMAITMLKQFYAIYLFVPVIDAQELNETILSYEKIGRLFDNLEVLLNCLSADIKFYSEQPLYIPILSVFSSQNNTKVKSKMDFTESQKKFAAFHLFVNTFREAPAFIGLTQNLYDRCFTLMENKSNGEYVKEILTSNKEQIFDWFVNVPFLLVIINSFVQEQFPQNLLDIQQVLIAIDQHFSELTPMTSSSTVYRVQFLREEDLEIIKTNINELITFHTYIVATKDLLTARTIARQAADRGLLIVILQIEIPAQAYVLELDNNRLMFRFDTIFRIRSINLAPDTVWYAQLNYADLDFQPIQERLQLQVGEQLTWLTLGNYLCALNYFDEAKFYYQYLSNALPGNHPALPSIYNNMGLIYAESGDHEESLKCYNTAIDLLDKISPNTDYTCERTLSQSAETGMTVDNCPLHHTMDEVHSQQSQWEEALECYRKALELAADPLMRLQYEQKIKDILSSK